MLKRNPVSELSHDVIFASLNFLIAHPQYLEDFCQQNGSTLGDIKTSITDPSFQASLLDYFINDQNIALELFKDKNITPRDFIKARQQLPGADRELVNML